MLIREHYLHHTGPIFSITLVTLVKSFLASYLKPLYSIKQCLAKLTLKQVNPAPQVTWFDVVPININTGDLCSVLD